MIHICPDCKRTEDTTEAHCRLHLAAADLLAALAGLIPYYEPVHDAAREALEFAEATIQKAEGK